MSKSAIVFCQESSSQAIRIEKLKKRIQPATLQVITPWQPVTFSLLGHYDYVLFTGYHGDFQNGLPDHVNGIKTNALDLAIQSAKFTTDKFILDNCFSSSFVDRFTPLLSRTGKIVCSHGTCQGYSSGLIDSNGSSTIADVFVTLLGALDGFGVSYNTISLYCHGEVSSSGTKGTLFTKNYDDLAGAIGTAGILGVNDTSSEINTMTNYLRGRGIAVSFVSSARLTTLTRLYLNTPI